MDIITLFSLAVGLAMDAFAVSICKGLAQEKLSVKHMVIAGLWFGGFQGFDAYHRIFSGKPVPGQDHGSGPLDRFYTSGIYRCEYDPGIPGIKKKSVQRGAWG